MRSRRKDVGKQLYFGTTKEYPDPMPVWSRAIRQDFPAEGVRIPYQEYLRQDLPVDDIICKIPRSAMLAFSYVAEHVTDDVAVAVLETLLQSVEQVHGDGKVPGDWQKRIAWLNDVLGESWSNRGPYPGLGSLLKYLGAPRAFSYQRKVAAELAKAGADPWLHVRSILDGDTPPEPGLPGGSHDRQGTVEDASRPPCVPG